MRAIVIDQPGGPDAMQLKEVPDPVAGPGELVIRIATAGVNRADIIQRLGFYPPPAGAPPYPGLECAGTVASVGAGVSGWAPGDEACALLAGGGYAEQVVVPAVQVLPVPAGVSVADAGGLPEVACTVHANVFMQAGLSAGETLLVHGGASGIGTMAIQLARARGARVACTAGSAEKLERCRELGADLAISYHDEDFVAAVTEFTDGRGADVILDIMGGAYLPRNVAALATGGRLVVIGLQGGGTGELDLGVLMRKRASVQSASLRARPVQEKGVIVAAVLDQVWPLVAAGQVKPVVDTILPLAEAGLAHRRMEESSHIGKILLDATATR